MVVAVAVAVAVAAVVVAVYEKPLVITITNGCHDQRLLWTVAVDKTNETLSYGSFSLLAVYENHLS